MPNNFTVQFLRKFPVRSWPNLNIFRNSVSENENIKWKNFLLTQLLTFCFSLFSCNAIKNRDTLSCRNVFFFFHSGNVWVLSRGQWEMYRVKDESTNGRTSSWTIAISYLQALRTTLWALRLVSAQTRVTSTSISACSNASNAWSMCVWWLFHRKE